MKHIYYILNHTEKICHRIRKCLYELNRELWRRKHNGNYAGKFKNRRAYDWSVEVTVYVRLDSRRAGVGKMLYHALEDSLKRIGVLNMNACIARPKEEDEHLCNDSFYFHEKMGFHLVGTFHDCGYKFNTWYDMIWMEKIIGEHQKHQRNVRYGEWTLE